MILTSDHGFSTISKESATSYAATQTYKDVPPGSCRRASSPSTSRTRLGMNLFDPDATATRDGRPRRRSRRAATA